MKLFSIVVIFLLINFPAHSNSSVCVNNPLFDVSETETPISVELVEKFCTYVVKSGQSTKGESVGLRVQCPSSNPKPIVSGGYTFLGLLEKEITPSVRLYSIRTSIGAGNIGYSVLGLFFLKDLTTGSSIRMNLICKK